MSTVWTGSRDTLIRLATCLGLLTHGIGCVHSGATAMTPQADFCNSLVSNDRRALRGAIDPLLEARSRGESVEARLARLLEWVRGQPCVASAQLDRGFLEREPPVQELLVELTDSAASASPPQLGKHRTLGITHAPDRLHFDYR